MKQLQGTFINGYVTVLVKGENPELFFQLCIERNITVWEVKKTAINRCEGNIKLEDVKLIRKLVRGTNYRLSFTNKKGYPFLIKRLIQKRPLWMGLLLAFVLFFFLSNIVWDIKVTGVPKEIEEKIVKQLNSYGIHPGAWILSLDSPNRIQQKLTKDIPELLWVGVSQKGTTYQLEGIEKIVVKEEESASPRNLIASKKGIIKRMYVEQGRPMVKVNDYVEPGDLLVSGEMMANNDEGEDEAKPVDIVAAKGEIYAHTWYEVDVQVPLKYHYEQVTGKKENKYFLKIGNFQFPIWGFGKPSFSDTFVETVNYPLGIFQWELPITLKKSINREKIYEKGERTKEEAVQIGIEQAKSEILLNIGADAKLLAEKVLHERIDDGKVKLKLYITVEENIVNEQPLTQGD